MYTYAESDYNGWAIFVFRNFYPERETDYFDDELEAWAQFKKEGKLTIH